MDERLLAGAQMIKVANTEGAFGNRDDWLMTELDLVEELPAELRS